MYQWRIIENVTKQLFNYLTADNFLNQIINLYKSTDKLTDEVISRSKFI